MRVALAVYIIVRTVILADLDHFVNVAHVDGVKENELGSGCIR